MPFPKNYHRAKLTDSRSSESNHPLIYETESLRNLSQVKARASLVQQKATHSALLASKKMVHQNEVQEAIFG